MVWAARLRHGASICLTCALGPCDLRYAVLNLHLPFNSGLLRFSKTTRGVSRSCRHWNHLLTFRAAASLQGLPFASLLRRFRAGKSSRGAAHAGRLARRGARPAAGRRARPALRYDCAGLSRGVASRGCLMMPCMLPPTSLSGRGTAGLLSRPLPSTFLSRHHSHHHRRERPHARRPLPPSSASFAAAVPGGSRTLPVVLFSTNRPSGDRAPGLRQGGGVLRPLGRDPPLGWVPGGTCVPAPYYCYKSNGASIIWTWGIRTALAAADTQPVAPTRQPWNPGGRRRARRRRLLERPRPRRLLARRARLRCVHPTALCLGAPAQRLGGVV